MSNFSAVSKTAIPVVGNKERRFGITGGILDCKHPVTELNLFASNSTARLRVLSCKDVCRRTFVSIYSGHFLMPRAVDQRRSPSGGAYAVKDVDDNNAAENAAEIARDTIHGVAIDEHERSEEAFRCDQNRYPKWQGKDGVEDPVTDSVNQEAQAMQRYLHGPEMEKGTVIRPANAALEEAAEDKNQVEGSSEYFGDQARRFQEKAQDRAQVFIDNRKGGASMASGQVKTAGTDVMNKDSNAFGQSPDEDEDMFRKTLKLRPEDFEEAYIDIEDGSAKENFHL